MKIRIKKNINGEVVETTLIIKEPLEDPEALAKIKKAIKSFGEPKEKGRG